MIGGRTTGSTDAACSTIGALGEEALDRRRDRLGPLHRREVAGARDRDGPRVREAAERLRRLAFAESGAVVAADEERRDREPLEQREAVGHRRLGVDLRLDRTGTAQLDLAVGTVGDAVVDVEPDELLPPRLERHLPAQRLEHRVAARPDVPPSSCADHERRLPRRLEGGRAGHEDRLDEDRLREPMRPGGCRGGDGGAPLRVTEGAPARSAPKRSQRYPVAGLLLSPWPRWSRARTWKRSTRRLPYGSQSQAWNPVAWRKTSGKPSPPKSR